MSCLRNRLGVVPTTCLLGSSLFWNRLGRSTCHGPPGARHLLLASSARPTGGSQAKVRFHLDRSEQRSFPKRILFQRDVCPSMEKCPKNMERRGGGGGGLGDNHPVEAPSGTFLPNQGTQPDLKGLDL